MADAPESDISAATARDLKQIATFRGNKGSHIIGLCLSADNQRAYTAGRDGDVCMWLLETGELVAQCLALDTPLTAMTVSPDERFLLTATAAGPYITVYDRATGSAIAELRATGDLVTSFAWQADGNKFVSAQKDGAVLVWDAAGFEKVEQYDTGLSGLQQIALSPDARQIAGAGEGGVIVIDRATGQQTRIATSGPSRTVNISPDGKRLAYNVAGSSPATNAVHVIDLDTWQPVFDPLPARFIMVLAFTPDASALTVVHNASGDYELGFWSADTGVPLASYSFFGGAHLAFTLDGRTVACGGFNATTVWKVQSPQVSACHARAGRETFAPASAPRVRELATLYGHGAGVTCAAFSPDGALLATGGRDRTVILWDVATGAERARLTGHRAELGIHGLAFSPDGTLLAARAKGGQLLIWSVPRREIAFEIRVPDASLNPVHSAAWHPDGTQIAAGYALYDARTGAHIANFGTHGSPTNQGAFSADGQLLALAVGGDTGYGPPPELSVCVYDVASRTLLAKLQAHPDWVLQAAFNPFGRLLAAVDYSGNLKIWQWPQQTVIGEGRSITTFLFGPAGLLIVANTDRSLRLLDLSQGGDGVELAGHTDRIHQLALNPAGTLLASVSEDRSVRLWGIPG